MSAFAVSRLTIDRAVTAMLLTDHNGEHTYTPGEQCDELGRNLMRMNRDALIARYGDKARNDISADDIAKYMHSPADRELIVLWQAMRCLRYQCAEGDVDKYPLFQELTKNINAIAMTIITNLPDYKSDKMNEAWQ